MSKKHDQDKEKQEVLQIIKDVLLHDTELREKHQVGEKFKFIRERLELLLTNAEEHFAMHQEKEVKENSGEIAEDEAIVYVHLFNAQGMIFNAWKKMISSSVFYEHSVNRPIYTERAHVEELIRAKSNAIQHGYLAVVVKEADLLTSQTTKDPLDNPVVKVREGSLDISKLLYFWHDGHQFKLNESGDLIEKI